VNLVHIQPVSRSKLGPLITTLGSRKMAAARSALLFALGF